MHQHHKIYIAGHTGMVGSAIVRKLKVEGFENLILRSSKELDLRNQSAVNAFFESEKLDYVFLAAAKVGGIVANNTYRADFLYENLMIEANVIHASYLHQVTKLLFLGSSCIYPKFAPQPMKEEDLLTGVLEPTNEPYAIAKIAGIKLCENYRRQYGCNFISAMPTNLYGPGDNFDPRSSHVIPALIQKFVDAVAQKAPEVTVWGTGAPTREFLYVEDAARAIVLATQKYSESEPVNLGSQFEISIAELAHVIGNLTGFTGKIVFDTSKPDGQPRRKIDTTRAAKEFGFTSEVAFSTGLAATVQWYKKNCV